MAMELVHGAADREWLETNGLGGFALSTVTGVHTRRYHGLLVAAQHPPGGRLCLLAKLEETLILNGQRYELAANQYADAVHPHGYQYLVLFTDQPYPTWRYQIGDAVLEKTLFLVDGQNTLVVTYRFFTATPSAAQLEIRPLAAFRDYHALTRENAVFAGTAEAVEGDVLSLKPYADLPALYFGHNATSVAPTGHWYRNFYYRSERARGLDHLEDLYQPFVLHFPLDRPAVLIASTEPHGVHEAEAFDVQEQTRRASHTPLKKAADQFLVRRAEGGQTVIAGYPWFTDWGRDTFIALRGL